MVTMMIAQVCGLGLGDFVHTFGDVHLYLNHIEQAETQLTRKPKSLPRMELNPNVNHIDRFVFDDFLLMNYDPDPHIPAPVAV